MNRTNLSLPGRSRSGSRQASGWKAYCEPTSDPWRPKIENTAYQDIPALLEKLIKSGHQRESLQKRYDELSKKVERHEKLLNEIFGTGDLPSFGPFEEWVSSKDSEPWKGKHVIYCETKGVIASAESLDELTSNLKSDLESGTSIGFIPSL